MKIDLCMLLRFLIKAVLIVEHRTDWFLSCWENYVTFALSLKEMLIWLEVPHRNGYLALSRVGDRQLGVTELTSLNLMPSVPHLPAIAENLIFIFLPVIEPVIKQRSFFVHEDMSDHSNKAGSHMSQSNSSYAVFNKEHSSCQTQSFVYIWFHPCFSNLWGSWYF